MTPKEARELWAQALESGKYKQGTGQLAVETDGGLLHCCLGVACEVAMETGVLATYDPDDGDLAAYSSVQERLGLRHDDGFYGEDDSLVKDNDTGGTFPEIAAIIRAEPAGLVTT